MRKKGTLMIKGLLRNPGMTVWDYWELGFRLLGLFLERIAYPYTTLMEHAFLGKIGTKLFCTFSWSAIDIFAAFRTQLEPQSLLGPQGSLHAPTLNTASFSRTPPPCNSGIIRI